MGSRSLYQPLGAGEIRVLYMTSVPGEQIAGRLKTISIERQPGLLNWLTTFQTQYEALSYCWGDPAKTHSIICDGQNVDIHANLHDALLGLKPKCPGVPIWTDAICIDQANEEEKTAQIRLMGKIYQTAGKVWAFLGNGPVGMEEAIPLLPLLCRRAQEIQSPQRAILNQSQPVRRRRLAELGPMGIQKIDGLPPRGSPFWQTIYDLIYSEYFNRLWVLQEAAFAKKVEFLVGNHVIPWVQIQILFEVGIQQMEGFLVPPPFPPISPNSAVFEMRAKMRNEEYTFFQRIVLNLVEWYLDWTIAGLERLVDPTDPNMQAILRPIHEMVQMVKSTNLEELIELSLSQECSEPRDRILAILGLLEAKSGARGLPLTYNQTVQELYLETFYMLVQKDAALEVLGLAISEPQNDHPLPSWCPNFHRKRGLQTGDTKRIRSGNRDWQAGYGTQIVSRGSDSTKLRLSGVQVCGVKVTPHSWTAINLHNKPQSESAVQAKVLANTAWLKQCLNSALMNVNPGSELYHETMDRFWRTMILDDFELIGSRDFNLEDFEGLLQLLERSIKPESSFAAERARLDSLEPKSDRKPVPRAISLILRLDCNITHKIFFRMDNSMFGMTYQGVQDHDVLCVFQGAKLPHLLRRRDESSWTFVGEAYVDALMHGEVENAFDADGRRVGSETFLLV